MDLTRGGPCPLGLPPRLRGFGMALPLMHCVCPFCPPKPAPKRGRLEKCAANATSKPPDTMSEGFLYGSDPGRALPPRAPPRLRGFGMALPLMHCVCPFCPPKPAPKRGRLEKCAANATSKPPDTMSEGFLYGSDPGRALPPRAPPRLRGFGMALPLMHCVCPFCPPKPAPKRGRLEKCAANATSKPPDRCPGACCAMGG